jgi:hypothetical protein
MQVILYGLSASQAFRILIRERGRTQLQEGVRNFLNLRRSASVSRFSSGRRDSPLAKGKWVEASILYSPPFIIIHSHDHRLKAEQVRRETDF